MIDLELLSTSTNYTIYLKNDSAVAENFWCFLEQPEGLSSSKVFANSAANLSVTPNYGGINRFTIPLQYMVGAGASNNAVGLDVRIDSTIMSGAQLTEVYEARYATVPPNQGPELSRIQGESGESNTIGLKSNTFNRVHNENNRWFSNMSFGIESSNGFMGVSWSPSPSVNHTITPKFSFYIATGSFTSYTLADISAISRNAAKVELTDFQNLEATVTRTSSGQWLVEGGRPS